MKKRNDLHGQPTAPRHGLQCTVASLGAQAGTDSIGSRVRALLRAGNEGQALIETAFTLAVLLMVLTGLFSFGMVMFQNMMLTDAVSSGAQNLQQIAASTADPCAATLTAIELKEPYLKPASISLTVTANGNAYTGTSCAGVTPAPQTTVTVYATYPCSYQVYKFTPSCQLKAESSEYIY